MDYTKFPQLINLCRMVAIFEGGKPSRKNPGNIRCGADIRFWNHLAIGADNGFCVFPSPEVGMMALQEKFYNICIGASAVFTNAGKNMYGVTSSADLTLKQCMSIYAPSSDGNNPDNYAKFLATKLGVSVDVIMGDLLNNQPTVEVTVNPILDNPEIRYKLTLLQTILNKILAFFGKKSD